MFSYIKGMLAETASDHIVIETGGVGFLVYVPALMINQLPPVGGTIKVYTHFQVRDDAFVLYGFLDRDDLEMFTLLIGVSGIGPKGGLAILSAIPVNDLRLAILSGDAKLIAKAPGIGAKTAQRVIIDLKDKVDFEEALEKKLDPDTNAPYNSSGMAQVENDAVLALVALGYSRTESLRAVRKAQLAEGMDTEDVLKAALKHMTLL